MKTFLLLTSMVSLFLLPLCGQGQNFSAKVDQVNRNIGIPLLPSDGKWERIALEKRLQGNGLAFQGSLIRRSVFLQDKKIFNIPAVELLVISNENGIVTQIDVIYSNKGDTVKKSKYITGNIRRDSRQLRNTLTKLFGQPDKKRSGIKGLRSNTQNWEFGKIRFSLEFSNKEYTILHIFNRDKTILSSSEGKFKVHGEALTGNVKGNAFGDVFIENIPMVNQGDKGYCVPATVERVLRYMGISNINMHQLADSADTGRGGGTYFSSIVGSLNSFCRNFGLKTHKCGELEMDSLKKYISRGMPVMWCMYVNASLAEAAAYSKKYRAEAKSPKEWLKSIRRQKVKSGGGAHMCLIVGYNEETMEIAVSNSWGDKELTPAWIKLKSALRVSMGMSLVLMPKTD